MSRYITTLVLVLATMVAAPARAQLADPRVASVRAELEALAQGLTDDGLPGEWIAAKVAEGLAKRAPAPAILAACRRLDIHIRAARDLAAAADVSVEPPVLRALVAALAAGYDAQRLGELTPLYRRSPTQGRAALVAVASSALAELSERGFERRPALAAVREAVRGGGQGAVRALVTRARSLRGSPAARSAALSNPGQARGRPEHSYTPGPPHDVGYGQGRGRGNGMSMGMGPP